MIKLLLTSMTAFAAIHASDPYTKITDNSGKGDAQVSGIRNVREVIPGILYRSGASAGSKFGPLKEPELQKLCKLGFDTYFYNYNRGKDTISQCGGNQVSVKIRPSLWSNKNVYEQLATIYQSITKQTGQVLTGCDQGVHASGFVSALSLIQFCDWTNKQALDYWTKIAVGQDNHPSIKKAIMDFKKIPALELSQPIRCFKP